MKDIKQEEIKAVWIIIDKKMWLKDNKKQRILHGCWLEESNAEEFAKKTYGEDFNEWVLVTPLLIMENNTLEKALQNIYSNPECIFVYCPNPSICKEDGCISKQQK